MSTPHSCPEHPGLRRALLESASAEEIERLARHLEVCSQCGETMDQMMEQDTLIEALRQSRPGAPETEGPVVQGLITRLQRLRDAATFTGFEPTMDGANRVPPSTGPSSPDGTRPGVTGGGGYDFLALPQGPGELGRLGAYRIVRELGAGGMGVVFLAEDTHLQRYVALKAIRPALADREQTRERFLREARAMAAVKNDHVVTIHQVGEDRGVPFLAMELMEGETLADRLKRDHRLPVTEVLRIGREIARGLEAAHRRGLIHRDIKPSNIWLEAGSGRVKILDFGLARAADDDSHLTQSGAVLGTPSYMAPEQAQDLPVDHRSDLFSFGCVLYQACTGQLPFQGKDVLSRLMALATVSPAPPCEVNAAVPATLSELILRLLAKDPSGRPESAAAVAEALAAVERELAAAEVRGSEGIHVGESLRDSLPVSERPGYVSTLPAARRFIPRRWLIATAASGALLLVAIVAGQIIIRITNRDGQVTEIKVPPGAQVEVLDTEKAPAGRASQPDKPGGQAKKPDVQIAALPDKAKPFVVIYADGKREEYKHFSGALAVLQAADAIEVYGNGPFLLDQVVLKDKPLALRAAPGYRPRFIEREGTYEGPWFNLQGVALSVDGCDFQNFSRGCFAGGGQPWNICDCRILRGAMWCAASFAYDGPHLSIRDSLLSVCGQNADASIQLAPKATLDLSNSIIDNHNWAPAIGVSPDGQIIRLKNNLLIGERFAGGFDELKHGIQPVQFDVRGNVFHFSTMNMHAGFLAQSLVRWKGENNLYTKSTLGNFPGTGQPQGTPPKGDSIPTGLAGWNKLCKGGEAGSKEVDDVRFRLGRMRWQSPEATIEDLRQIVAELRGSRRAKADFGPNVDLLGPGDAYVRALAAAGKPVPKDQLRPEAPDGGPCVLIRGGQVVRGYTSLQEAADAVQSGDVIEIRSDGPLDGCSKSPWPTPDRTNSLMIRAAPGYRPVLKGSIDFSAGAELSVEGIHFHNAGLIGGNPHPTAMSSLIRMANCSFEGRFPEFSAPRAVNAGVVSAEGKPAEIVNCLVTGSIRAKLTGSGRLDVRNSLVEGICFSYQATPRLSVNFDQSAVIGQCAIRCEADTKTQLRLSARGTLFDLTDTLVIRQGGCDLAEWKGEGNVYRLRRWPWCQTLYPNTGDTVGLEDWQKRWQSDADSSQSDPSIYDPRQWQLLPLTPGEYQGPDGRDFGPNMTKIATVTTGQAMAGSRSGEPLASTSGDADRRAAEWVLSLGGTVTIRVAGQEKDMAAAKDLPADPWQVIKVRLGGTEVSDAGLEHLRGLANVTYLGLDAPVSDAGLEHLKGMTKLANLSIGHSRVTGSGLRHLKALPNLAELNLSFSPVTDAGLEGIKDLTQLKALSLHGTAVTDAGLVNLKVLTKLTHLWLPSQLSDAGLEHVTALPELNLLSLSNTRVTDAGLPKLLGIAKLGCLQLEDARVSAKGFADLKSVLPGVSLGWSERNRTAAEAVLAAGGQVSVRPKGQQDDRPVTAVSELPADYFHVTRVSLVDAPKIPDDLFGKLSALNEPEFDNLEAVDLSGSPIQDCRGLEGLTTLKDLSLARTKVGDAGLEPLKSLKGLRRLVLDGCPISGPGLAHLKGLPSLTELRLACPSLGDLGVMVVGQMKSLERLSLAGSSVSDEGLKHLQGLTNLKALVLSQTKVTAIGLAELQKALPQSRVQFAPAAKPAEHP